ncbi:hypothetical protein [Streptomyces sp. NRRL B-24572]|uniref:hypothetical protein n=1 Tax=Streptomyces sp. NRRL B-24572 TaxID=1962156 RepID=UPI000A37BA97|nr:hypothetical protein [Streptomyces sp. NRRL B-24572]
MSGSDWTEVVGAAGLFLLITIVITVVVWQLGATHRAKAALAREGEYRRLAEAAVDVQQRTERQLEKVRERLESMERILKEVE